MMEGQPTFYIFSVLLRVTPSSCTKPRSCWPLLSRVNGRRFEARPYEKEESRGRLEPPRPC
jgi:hypothetical protein